MDKERGRAWEGMKGRSVEIDEGGEEHGGRQEGREGEWLVGEGGVSEGASE